MRILVAEDEKSLNRIITRQLSSVNYSVDSCFDGEEALDCFSFAEYDAAVLDVNMPKLDGFSLVKKIRAKGINVPVLFLTARDSIEDRVEGLDIGADDYLVKPFSFDELLARIRVMIRRKADVKTSVLTCGDLSLDLGSHKVMRGEKNIELTAKEFELLRCLMLHKGNVLSREQIENHIWNFDYEGGTNVVDVYIRYLRKKIDDDYEKKLIRTVRGSGYVIRESY